MVVICCYPLVLVDEYCPIATYLHVDFMLDREELWFLRLQGSGGHLADDLTSKHTITTSEWHDEYLGTVGWYDPQV